MIHQANQVKSENELQMLNNMINKVREVRDALVSSLVKNINTIVEIMVVWLFLFPSHRRCFLYRAS